MGTGEFLTLLGAVIGAGGTVSALLLRMEGRVKRVETIVARELTPNGGESLRDRVVRIEARMWVRDHRTAAHIERDGDG